MAKLDLKGKNKIDPSKAKLPLGENEKSSLQSISPQLDLNANNENKKTAVQQAIEKLAVDFQATEKSKKTAAEQLTESLAKAYNNPIFKAYMQAEEDRKALINASIEKWNEPSLHTKMREYVGLLKNPDFAMALEVPTSIRDYAAQMTNSFDSKNYPKVKETLEGFHPQMSTAYSVAQSALEQMRKTIASPSIESSFSKLPNLGFYESAISKVAESIAKNEDILDSSKILAGLGTSLASDSLKLKMDEQSRITPEILKREYIPIKIPENPIPKQNAQIINILEILKEQNDTLIEINTDFLNFERSDQDIQNNIIILMGQQQNSSEIMIEELKAQNNGIENQLKELKRQNDNLEKQLQQNEEEIADNRDSNSFTRKLALWGIGISIFVGILSSIIPYHISNKEKIENDSDNAKLLGATNNKTVENQKQDQLIKLIEEENKYLKKLSERESK